MRVQLAESSTARGSARFARTGQRNALIDGSRQEPTAGSDSNRGDYGDDVSVAADPPRPEAPRLGCGSVRQGEALPQRKGFEDSAHPRFLRGSAHRQLLREPAPTRASNGYFFVSAEAYDAVKAGTRAT